MSLSLRAALRRVAIGRVFYTLLIAAALAVWSFPVVLTVITALKTDAEVLSGPLALPRHPTLDAFFEVWELLGFRTLLWNSLVLSLGGTFLAIVFAVFPSYALSRFRIPGREIIFLVLLTGMMLPQQTVVIPLYDILRRLNLLDSQLGLILVHGVYGMPFQILILRGFMASLPEELESAARVDGCSDFGVFWHIILPLSTPAIAVAGTLNFLNIWREFFFALVFLSSSASFPVTVGILKITQSQYFSSWNLPAAALLIAQLPTVILYILAYRWIQRGLLAGALKG